LRFVGYELVANRWQFGICVALALQAELSCSADDGQYHRESRCPADRGREGSLAPRSGPLTPAPEFPATDFLGLSESTLQRPGAFAPQAATPPQNPRSEPFLDLVGRSIHPARLLPVLTIEELALDLLPRRPAR
jgi:hypothetical protein